MKACDIQDSLGYLTEAHTHVLANMTNRSIVVMQEMDSRLSCLLFNPGYRVQVEVTRQKLQQLLSEAVPPVIIHLESGHYSALVPDAEAAGKKSSAEELE